MMYNLWMFTHPDGIIHPTLNDDVGTWRATSFSFSHPFVILRSLRRRISVTPTLCFQILRSAQDDKK